MVSLRGLNDNLDITCQLIINLLVGVFQTSDSYCLFSNIVVAIPYFNWSIVEAGLIIITGSVPYLRPLMATILPEFFRSHNFTSLAISGKSKNVSAGSSTALPSSSDTHGDITITKEFHLEETDALDGDGFDSRPPGTPMTPLAPRPGPRMLVSCEKVNTRFGRS